MRLFKWVKSYLDTVADPMFSTLGGHMLAIEQERRRIKIEKTLNEGSENE